MTKVYLIEKSYLIRLALKNVIQSVNYSFEIKEAKALNEMNLNNISNTQSVFFIDTNLIKNGDEALIIKLKGKKNIIILISETEADSFYADGYIYLNDDSETVHQKIKQVLENSIKTRGLDNESKALSNREIDILKFVALGLTNKEIADKLFLSTHTVITHRKNISAKLGIKTIAGFTVYALLNKILLPEDLNAD